MNRMCRPILVLLPAVFGCDPTPDGKVEEPATDGATDWTLYDTGRPDTPDTTGEDPLPDDDTAEESGVESNCPQPTECISLAEAVDRGFAAITYDGDLDVENTGPYPICAGRWHTFFSDTSQDAIAGHTDVVWPGEPEDAFQIDAPDVWGHRYARTSGGPAWWCIERTQVTASGSTYRFTGARAPDPLQSFVHTDSDTNSNGVEDHTDYADPSTGAPWTNHNIWDHLAAQPTYVVGRIPNYLELQPGTSAPLTIEVVNLGRDTSTVAIEETLPPGARGYEFSIRPTTSETNADGSTTHRWYFKMDASVDDPDLSSPTDYDRLEIDYRIAWERPDCGYREKLWAPEVTWTDNSGATYTSLGTELILVCCDGS
jgi:hypothetical protein